MILIKLKIAAAAAVLAIASGTVNAAASDMENITVLGDSISTGYGLEEESLAYCEYLQQYFDAELDNFAKDGRQTSELIDQIENDKEVRSSLENADLVCVTIGGNDVMHIFEDALYSWNSGSMGTAQGQSFFSQEFVQSFIMQYASAFGPAAASAGENIGIIRDKINEINPEASVVMQTIYNPFETDDENLNSIMKPMKTFTSLYLGVINNAVRRQPAVIADIHKKLDEKSWLYTNIKNFDIHPNFLGHMLIAEEIIQNLREPGNGEVFRTQLEKIPREYYSGIPEDVTGEILRLADGEFRAEQVADADTESLTAEPETEETAEEVSEETQKNTEINDKSGQKKKSRLSKVLLYTGIILIAAATALRFYSKKKRKTYK